MFERFTDAARGVVVYAQEESRLVNDRHIGTEHLLLSLMAEPGVVSSALVNAGLDREAARRRMADLVDHPAGTSGHILFTERVKRALQEAADVADRLRQDRVGPPHLLGGLLSIRECRGVHLLTSFGVDVDALATAAEELAAEGAQSHDRGRPAARGTLTASFVATTPPLQLQCQRDRQAAALRRYGSHEDECDPAAGCTCGLDQALTETDHDGR